MTAAPPVDMTAADSPDSVEIRTPAGIIRVFADLIDHQTSRSVVLIEVEMNTERRRRTGPGGHWSADARTIGDRAELRLTRERED